MTPRANLCGSFLGDNWEAGRALTCDQSSPQPQPFQPLRGRRRRGWMERATDCGSVGQKHGGGGGVAGGARRVKGSLCWPSVEALPPSVIRLFSKQTRQLKSLQEDRSRCLLTQFRIHTQNLQPGFAKPLGSASQ